MQTDIFDIYLTILCLIDDLQLLHEDLILEAENAIPIKSIERYSKQATTVESTIPALKEILRAITAIKDNKII